MYGVPSAVRSTPYRVEFSVPWLGLDAWIDSEQVWEKERERGWGK